MKKILLLLLLFIPLFACGGASDSTTTEDSSQLPFLRYKKESGGMTILGLDGDYPSDIVIPSSIKGVTVKRINKSALRNQNSFKYVKQCFLDTETHKLFNNLRVWNT